MRNEPATFAALAELKPGWDSYDGLPIDPESIASTKLLLSLLPEEWQREAQLVPCPDGSVQLEWHRGDVDLEVIV